MPVFDDILFYMSCYALCGYMAQYCFPHGLSNRGENAPTHKILSVFPRAISAILKEHLCHCDRNVWLIQKVL